jgi:hypothetical protein
MSFITDTQLAVKKNLDQFDACNLEEQWLLMVLAVIYKPVHQAQLNLILAGLYDAGVFGRDLPLPVMAANNRNQLIFKKLIEQNSRGIRLINTLHHSLMLKCIADGCALAMIAESNHIVPVKPHHSWGYQEPVQKQTQFRQDLYRQDFDKALANIEFNKNPQEIYLEESDCLVKICFFPFDQDFFVNLPGMIQYQAFASLMASFNDEMQDNTEVVALLQSLYEQGYCNENMCLLLAEQYLLRGEVDKVKGLIGELQPSAYKLSVSGWLNCLQGNYSQSIADFEQTIVAKNKIARRVRQHVGGLAGLFYTLALLKVAVDDNPNLFSKLTLEVNNYKADQRGDNDFLKSYDIIDDMARVLSGKLKAVRTINFEMYRYDEDYHFRLAVLFNALCCGWSRNEAPEQLLNKLGVYATAAAQQGNLWYAQVASQVLVANGRNNMARQKFLDSRPKQTGDLVNLVAQKEAWLQALDQLIAFKQPDESQTTGAKPALNQVRLAWYIYPFAPYKIEGKEQKMGKKGWSKGRVVALKRLRDAQQEFDYLTLEDLRICSAIMAFSVWGHYGDKVQHCLDGYKALKACIGHPAVFSIENASTSIDIIEGQPELMITESGGGYKIHMPGLPEEFDSEDEETCFSFTLASANRYLLTPFTGQHLKIADIVGSKGLKIPSKAKDKVLESIAAIAPLLNIQSDIQGIGEVDTGVEEVEPDQTLYINIQPSGQGLQMECHIQPLGELGPHLLPGSGNSMVVAQIEDQRIMTHRALDVETRHLDLLVSQVPFFDYMVEHILLLDDLEDALTCLEQLNGLSHDANANSDKDELNVVLQWPKGKELKLTKTVSQQQMQVTVGKKKDWFSLEGELSIGDDEVIDLKNLLILMQHSQGRFVQMEGNRFIALTEQLRKQLTDIAATAFDGKFHPLATPLIEEATMGMTVKSPKAWQQQLKKLKESFKIEAPLPATLQADLRSYQVDGFDWAYRLAHWGAGACLADDMGLGKTLQALAMILSRTAQGPTLVLAPTSVCFNWQEEAMRFAPTLKVNMFGMGSKKARQQMLDEAAPFELIICSYGLLQTQGEQLQGVDWHTIIADEAQAIKNPQAKRTQAAMGLKGDFKMITTGTPIENNLTELWSLFRFINPGLLGSKEQFVKRFVNAIENPDKDEFIRKETSKALRRMISPFILRRLKSQVLTELPSRTEINLHVELSREELTFYEALRQQAVENLLKSDAKPGQKRIKILAEIMRLRRACCHPSLVVAESDIEGSKLKVFDNLVDELMQGGHRALVFSQFVGHLAILKQHLQDKGVSFQYLDGSTSSPNRKKAVNAFQGGEGDLFLISLKAGGAGLNLTAADYVIHMDPWWNPAVEDQASDRAHRMGQTRPVTIYRLITQNTIEDKIVSLHQQKRDLANSLLEGTDSTGNLSLDDMMNLLNDEQALAQE